MLNLNRLAWLKAGAPPRNVAEAAFRARLAGGAEYEKTAGPADIVTVTDALAKPLIAHTVSVLPVQGGSGDPSPDNIRSISGWTGANVYHAGKNLLGPIATGTRTNSHVTFTSNADGSISLNGTASANVTYWLNTTNVDAQYRYPIVGRTQYTLSGCPSGGSTTTYRLVGYLDYGTTYANRSLSDVGVGSNANTSSVVFDSIRVMIDIKSGTNCDGLVFRPQLELGSTVSTYTPYTGQTYPVSWQSEAGTVYGGTLDVLTGKLTVDSASVDLGNLTWSYESNYSVFVCYTFSGAKNIGNTDVPNALCTMYKAASWHAGATDATNNGVFCMLPSYNQLRVRNLSYTDANTFKTAMSGQTLVYELATPVEYTLSDSEIITLLKGTNNLWANCGQTTITYTGKQKPGV